MEHFDRFPARCMQAFSFLFALTFLGLLNSAQAATYYAAADAPPGGDGSSASPWNSIQVALKSGKIRGGDELLLRDGSYGFVKIVGARFDKPVLIAAAPGAKPHLDALHVQNSAKITFRGLRVWPSRGMNDVPLSLVRSYRNSPDIVIDSFDVRGREDAANYRKWSKQDWLNAKASGIAMGGTRNIAKNNTVMGVFHGIQSGGERSSLLNNKIWGFDGDAMRALGDYSVVRGNSVRDCVAANSANHDDGFQTWSLGKDRKPDGGTVVGLVLENNIIEEWSGPRDHPFICSMQGFFMKGYLNDLVVQNNVLSVSAWHGITAYGVTGGRIINNTLVNSRGPSSERPWIGLWGFQTRGDPRGRGSTQVVIANNVVPVIKVNGNGRGTRLSRNALVPYPANALVAPFAGDFRPKPGGRLIDAADAAFAPDTDIEGNPRPLGRGPDIGAYEVK